MENVDIRQIGSEGTVLKWCESAKSLGLDAEPEFEFPILIEVEAKRLGVQVFFNGTVGCRVKLACCRCLESVEQEISAEIVLEFTEGPPPQKEEDVVEDSEAEEHYYTAPFIDFSDDLRQALLMVIPAYPVCRESCQGLCPECGVDRNKAACKCRPTVKDSPFKALRSMIQKEQ